MSDEKLGSPERLKQMIVTGGIENYTIHGHTLVGIDGGEDWGKKFTPKEKLANSTINKRF